MKKTRIQKNEDTLKSLWDNLKHSNLQIIGVPEGEEKQQEIENLHEQIMKENRLPRSGEGNRLPGSPGSSESQRN